MGVEGLRTARTAWESQLTSDVAAAELRMATEDGNRPVRHSLAAQITGHSRMGDRDAAEASAGDSVSGTRGSVLGKRVHALIARDCDAVAHEVPIGVRHGDLADTHARDRSQDAAATQRQDERSNRCGTSHQAAPSPVGRRSSPVGRRSRCGTALIALGGRQCRQLFCFVNRPQTLHECYSRLFSLPFYQPPTFGGLPRQPFPVGGYRQACWQAAARFARTCTWSGTCTAHLTPV